MNPAILTGTLHLNPPTPECSGMGYSQAYRVEMTDTALAVRLFNAQGEPVAGLRLELDDDGKLPRVRVWDAESGLEGAPVYTRYLYLAGKA